jgi:large subunit ribosomal protein L7/L12
MADEKKLSNKVEKLIEEISNLSVLELADMVSALQEKFGVSAMPVSAAPAAAAAAPAADAGAAGAASSTQTVVMTAAGANKIAVIKALREINQNLGLKEAKDMTEALPATILDNVKAEEAKVASEKLTAAGATVELK